VARELPTAAGPLDLLFINPRGYLTLVETKLWRNPTARREVVGQLIDYTKEIARWSYGELLEAIRVARALIQRSADATDPLVDLARAASPDFDERDFVDNVQRGLRRGQFLILIVGDGIRQEVVQIADFLQSTPTLGFTLGLVELALFRTGEPGDETLFVQPRTLARTEVLTRAVVEVRGPSRLEDVSVTLPVEDESEAKVAKVRRKITEEEFLRKLRENASPAVVDFARWAMQQADGAESGLAVRWGETGPLFKYFYPAQGGEFTLCGFSSDGKLKATEWVASRCQQHGLPDDIWQKYLRSLAAMCPGAEVRQSENRDGKVWFWVGTPNRDYPKLADLVSQQEAWLTLLQETIEALRLAMEQR
jgi:hypothetical protein